MSVNRYRPHVLVLPEDDANRQVANGFLLDNALSPGSIQVLPEAGGWMQVLARFHSNHESEMELFAGRFMVLLIDFDGNEERITGIKAQIPQHLAERVFVLGALSKPEALRQASLGSYEQIGLAAARDCREDTAVIWGHDLLRHNVGELERLRTCVRPILFAPK